MTTTHAAVSDILWRRYVAAQVNERYHQVRRARLESFQDGLTLFGALLGLASGSVLLLGLFPQLGAVAALLAGGAAAVAGVLRPADRAAVHRSLAVCYRLSSEELGELVAEDDPPLAAVRRALARYAAIEVLEADREGPADLAVLEAAQNQIERSLGLTQQAPPPPPAA